MHVEQIQPDILLFRGEAYQSIATAFLAHGNALLVDALASAADAAQMRFHLEDELKHKVRTVVLTHCMSDHIAGVRLFADAQVIAHRYYMHTYLSQRQRSREEDEQFVRPTMTFDGSLSMAWGRHDLRVFHNPGKTLCSVAVDAPGSDLLLCGDCIVGNTVYFSGSAPELIGEALSGLRSLGRGTVIAGHMGAFAGSVLANAQHYLQRISALVREIRRRCSATAAQREIREIRIEDCLAEGVDPSGFEREWHTNNLERVIERGLFIVPPGRVG